MIATTPQKDIESWSLQLKEYDYSMFITHQWLDSFGDDDKIPIYFNLVKNGKTVAKIAGLSIGRKGNYRYKLYFFAGPALRSSEPEDLYASCYRSILRYGKNAGYHRVICMSYDFPHIPEDISKMHYHNRSEYIIDLTQDRQTLLKNISRHVHRKTRKAQSKGYTLHETRDPEYVDHLIDLMEETRCRRLGKGYTDYRMLSILFTTRNSLKRLVANGGAVIHLAKKGDDIASIRIQLIIEQRAYALYIGHTKQSYEEGVSNFIDFNSIFLLKEQGVKYLNLGGILCQKVDSGVEKYKRCLGAVKNNNRFGSTGFLRFPYTMINPVVNASKALPPNKLTGKFRDAW